MLILLLPLPLSPLKTCWRCFFSFILNYMRDSYIGLESFGKEDLHFLEELSHEAQFFNIAGLCSDISRR